MHLKSVLSNLLCPLLLLAGLAFSNQPVAAQEQEADLILHDAKVLTVDKGFSIAEAVAIKGNKILAVGGNGDILKLRGAGTESIDLKGRTVVPGFIDTHRHSYAYAESTYGGLYGPEMLNRHLVDWRGVRSKEDVLNQIKGLMDKYKFKPGQWIYFINQLEFIGNADGTREQAKILYNDLNQWELDKVTPNNPIVMTMGFLDINGVLVNKKAMDYLWGKYGDFIKINGRFWIDKAGRPDGHLEPPACLLMWSLVYDRPAEILAGLYKRQIEEESSMGLTTNSGRLPQDAVRGYQWLEARGELNQRLGYEVTEALDNGAIDLKAAGSLKQYAEQVGTGTDKIWITSVGIPTADGTTGRACSNQKRLGTYSAIDNWWPMGQCYLEQEYKGPTGLGAPIRANLYKDWILASGRDGVRFANAHVAGDRAVELLLNMVEQVQKQYGPQATKNWAFDHCDMVNPADFKRLARDGITMSCYVQTSIKSDAQMAKAFGNTVVNTFSSPVKSMLDAGVKVVLESDSNSFVWTDIQAAVTRKDPSGKVWAPQERVDRVTALKMYTRWPAQYVLKEDQLGSIEPGKFADLVVLDKDYLTVPADEIGKLQPQMTVFDGRIIFVHSQFALENNLRPKGALISTYPELIAQRKSMGARVRF